ncbi:MAG: hypothetical protein ACI4WH_03220 [Oscillospiraceae bacterium]
MHIVKKIIIYNIKEVQADTLEIPFMYETTGNTWEYKDMKASEPCFGTITVKTTDTNGNLAEISTDTDKIPIYIDTKRLSKIFTNDLK